MSQWHWRGQGHSMLFRSVFIMVYDGLFPNLAKHEAGQQWASVYCECAAIFLVMVASCVWPQPNSAHIALPLLVFSVFPSPPKPYQLSSAAPMGSVTHSYKSSFLHCVLLSLLEPPIIPQQPYSSPMVHTDNPCLHLLNLPRSSLTTCTGCFLQYNPVLILLSTTFSSDIPSLIFLLRFLLTFLVFPPA